MRDPFEITLMADPEVDEATVEDFAIKIFSKPKDPTWGELTAMRVNKVALEMFQAEEEQ